jgi:hypothetical protein
MVELTRGIPPSDYSTLIQNGGALETADIYQQGAGTQQLDGRETPIPSAKIYRRMLPGRPEKNRIGPKGLLATKRLRGTRGDSARTREIEMTEASTDLVQKQ